MIDDARARVPFAMIGVLLLVGSATVAATIGPGDPASEPAVESTLDRATATVNAELRGAATAAAEDAAGAPVIDPANTSWGGALDDSAPFADALRVRLYVETRERLDRLERRRGDVRVTASLPPTPNASALGRAIDRVSIERADENGTAMTVALENVTLGVRRNDRIVATRSVTPSVTVATPTFAMHERVSKYERRLNAGIDEPGLTQRLTAQISAVAWARGWAQNRGAPIDNVLANRHVELATNAGTLDVQRTAIGHVDRQGLRRVSHAGLAVAGQDVLAGTGAASPRAENLTDGAATEIRRPGSDPLAVFDPPDGPRADDETVVGVNRSADDRYLAYIDGGLASTIESVYTARTRLRVSVRDSDGGEPPPPGRPGPGWAFVDERRRTSTSVGAASGQPPTGGRDWDRIDGYVREVRLHHERERVWARANETTTTASSSSERATVGIALLLRYDTNTSFWDAPVAGLYEHGAGPLSGPNLAGIDERARAVVVDGRGGPDAIAARAVQSSVDERPVDVTGERPDGLREWILADLNDLRERLREQNVSVKRGDVASFEVNPPGELERQIADDRREIVDPPSRFDGVADRARVAARAAYLDRVREELARRATRHSGRAGDTSDHLGDGASIETLQRHVGAGADRPERRVPTITGPDGPVRLRVDASPSYLSVAPIDDGDLPAANGTEHPLVARNVNVFTVPHGDVDDAVANVSFDVTDTTRLATAARALRTANETLARETSTDLANRRDALQTAVAATNGNLESRLVLAIVEEGVADPSEARSIVRDATADWNSTHERALAMANGSAASPVAAEAADRIDVPDHEADRLRLTVDRKLRAAVDGPAGRPRALLVNETAAFTRSVADDVFNRAIDDLDVGAIGGNRSYAHVPAGLPLAPAPGTWYATTNLWTVTVRGEYARFGVRTTRAGPTAPGGDGGYVRDGANVTLDVDGDGDEEVLGRATRIRFEATAGTAVLVPPGPQGVGDVGGERNETSAGWPAAGPK